MYIHVALCQIAFKSRPYHSTPSRRYMYVQCLFLLVINSWYRMLFCLDAGLPVFANIAKYCIRTFHNYTTVGRFCFVPKTENLLFIHGKENNCDMYMNLIHFNTLACRDWYKIYVCDCK